MMCQEPSAHNKPKDRLLRDISKLLLRWKPNPCCLECVARRWQ